MSSIYIWIWRRMEKLSWLDKVTEEVLRKVNENSKYFGKGTDTSMDWPCFET